MSDKERILDNGRHYPIKDKCTKCGLTTMRKIYARTRPPRNRAIFRSYCTHCKLFV